MSSGIDYVFIVIGMNVNVPAFPGDLAGMTISLLLEREMPVSREVVTAEILNSFWKYHKIFLGTRDLSGFSRRD